MRKLLLTAATAAVLGSLACHDSSLAPSGSPNVLKGSSALASLGTQTLTKQFAINPSGTTTVDIFGVFTVRFPNGSVCDPSITSSCVPITSPITVTATVTEQNGRVWVDFAPHLKFIETASAANSVTISTSIYSQAIVANKSFWASHKSLLRKYSLYFSESIGGGLIDEGRTDGSMRTRISLSTGIIWRKITHFSGYNIFTGEVCQVTVEDPNCIEEPPEDPPDEDPPGDPPT